MIQHLNDQRLEEIVADAIVDGTAAWWAVAFLDYGSIPCGHFRPELLAASNELGNRIKFYSIDACENPTVARELDIIAVPTLLVFRGDDEAGRYEGPYSREALLERLGKLVGKA